MRKLTPIEKRRNSADPDPKEMARFDSKIKTTLYESKTFWSCRSPVCLLDDVHFEGLDTKELSGFLYGLSHRVFSSANEDLLIYRMNGRFLSDDIRLLSATSDIKAPVFLVHFYNPHDFLVKLSASGSPYVITNIPHPEIPPWAVLQESRFIFVDAYGRGNVTFRPHAKLQNDGVSFEVQVER